MFTVRLLPSTTSRGSPLRQKQYSSPLIFVLIVISSSSSLFYLFFSFAEAQLCTGRILNFGRNSLKRTGTPGSHRNRPKFHLKWNKGCVIPVFTLVRYSVSAVPAEIPDFGRKMDTGPKQKHRLLCNFSLA